MSDDTNPKTTNKYAHFNHYHEITENQEFVDYGTGEFIADKEMIPLLQALNNIGLETTTHNYDLTNGAAWVAIKTSNVSSINQSYQDGAPELLISWDSRKKANCFKSDWESGFVKAMRALGYAKANEYFNLKIVPSLKLNYKQFRVNRRNGDQFDFFLAIPANEENVTISGNVLGEISGYCQGVGVVETQLKCEAYSVPEVGGWHIFHFVGKIGKAYRNAED